MITAELHKGIYVYYRCTFGNGKHAFPYLRESKVAEMLGLALKQIAIPVDVASMIARFNEDSATNEEAKRQQTITRLHQRLNTVNTRINNAYDDLADRNIEQEFWAKKMQEWGTQKAELEADLEDAQRITPQNNDLTGERVLDLAARAHEIYGSLTNPERAELLHMMISNVGTDGVTIHPNYRQPFNLIARGVADIQSN